jgi:hypothetical protein
VNPVRLEIRLMTKEEILKMMHGHTAAIPPATLAGTDRAGGGGLIDARIAQLEVENTRLQKLVAELLLKNQQLRRPDG